MVILFCFLYPSCLVGLVCLFTFAHFGFKNEQHKNLFTNSFWDSDILLESFRGAGKTAGFLEFYLKTNCGNLLLCRS